jgi:hypothetical protein
MRAGPDAELKDIAVLVASVADALDDKERLRCLVDAIKRRPDSPLSSAVGTALEQALEKEKLLPKVPRG